MKYSKKFFTLFFLIICIFILYSTSSFALQSSNSVPIYANIPEYVRLTDFSKNRLNLSAKINNYLSWVEDELSFSVISNVNYQLEVNFQVLEELSDIWIYDETLKFLIENNYKIIISDVHNNELIDTKDRIHAFSGGIPGKTEFFLNFKLWVWGGTAFHFFEGQIGNITVTVSSI